MSTYSFRAECRADVDRLLEMLPSFESVTMKPVVIPRVGPVPDVLVELRTHTPYEKLKSVALTVADGHVMVETLRPCSLDQNNLQRRDLKE